MTGVASAVATYDAPDELVPPHGGTLVDLVVGPARARRAARGTRRLAVLDAQPAPVARSGAPGDAAASRPCAASSGAPTTRPSASPCAWPTAPCGRSRSRSTWTTRSPAGSRPAVRSRCATPRAISSPYSSVEDVWRPDRAAEAQAVFGTTDLAHPGVAHLLERHPRLVRRRHGGSPASHRATTNTSTCATRRPSSAPSSRRRAGTGSWASRPGTRCTAPTSSWRGGRRPTSDAKLLVHPVVGIGKPGDVPATTRGSAATRQ